MSIALFIVLQSLYSQIPDTLWTRTYGGEFQDEGYFVTQTSDGGYIIAGETNSFGAGNWDIYLIKTDKDGNVQWAKTYGGDRKDYSWSVQQTSDGGYIIAGWTFSFSVDGDIYLIKTDANGDTLWTRIYGGDEYDVGYSVQETSDGGYIVSGATMSYGSGDWDVYVIRINSDGEVLWARAIGGSERDVGYSVQETSDGGYIVSGATMSYGSGDWDVYVIKLDSTGNLIWTKVIGDEGKDVSYSICETSDGGYIITGSTKSCDAGGSDVFLIKMDSDGNITWTREIGGEDCDIGKSVIQAFDGGYIVAGASRSFGEGDWDIYVVKTDSGGNVIWTKTMGGVLNDYAHSICKTADGGYIIAGETWSFGSGGNDVYLIKLGDVD